MISSSQILTSITFEKSFFFFNTNQATLTCYFRELRHEHTFVGAIIQPTTVVLSFPGGSVVKNLSPAQETQVQSLSREDFLEKEMTTHSNILAWRIPWTESLAGYSPWGHKRIGHNS